MVALLLFCAGTAVSADLGRMFFTPEQRATLDNARKKNLRIEIGTDNVQPPAAPVPQNLSVNGIVRRSDGKSTIWLNNRAVIEPRADGINVVTGKNDNRVKLTDPASGRSVDLKVGQTVEILSGTIQENYERRPRSKPETRPAAGSESGSIPENAAQVNAGEPATSRSRKIAQRRRVIDDLIDAAAAGDQRENRPPNPDRTEIPIAPIPMVREPAY
jgi:hypothetical protein